MGRVAGRLKVPCGYLGVSAGWHLLVKPDGFENDPYFKYLEIPPGEYLVEVLAYLPADEVLFGPDGGGRLFTVPGRKRGVPIGRYFRLSTAERAAAGLAEGVPHRVPVPRPRPRRGMGRRGRRRNRGRGQLAPRHPAEPGRRFTPPAEGALAPVRGPVTPEVPAGPAPPGRCGVRLAHPAAYPDPSSNAVAGGERAESHPHQPDRRSRRAPLGGRRGRRTGRGPGPHPPHRRRRELHRHLPPVRAVPDPPSGGLGSEAAGVVEAVGPGVTVVKPGDRVAYAGGPPGSYSEARLIPAHMLVPIPDGVADETAAAVMLKGMTAQYLIRRTYPVKPGETVLFHAAAGGVGLIACQWLKALGATVIGTVGSDEKAAVAEGPRLRARHHLDPRGHRQAGAGDHRRGRRAGGVRLGRQGHVPRLARLPAAARPDGQLRQLVREGDAVRHRHPVAEGVAVPHPADAGDVHRHPGRPGGYRRRTCST